MIERLRIAQVAPVAGPVRSDATGSVEQLVWLLTEELVSRQHEVTLFATGDSETSARLLARYPRGYDEDRQLWRDEFHEALHLGTVFEHAREFDVIHSHAYQFALPFIRLVDTPVVHSYHVLPDVEITRAYARYPEAHVAAISRYQRRRFSGVAHVDVVYHGINIDAFTFSRRPGDYLAFLGRMLPGKGPLEAIELARALGARLILAGPDQQDYYRTVVAPRVDGRQIEYIGPVNARQRTALLAGAAALLYPILAPEPFGLVMVEAMACGTPVAALRRGAVPEIVEDGVTGYSARHLSTLADCIPATLALDRARVRQGVGRFDFHRMVDDYLAVYQRLVAEQRRRVA